MAVAAELMGEGTYVIRALHVVLPAQRINTNTRAAEIASYHRQISHRQDRSAALAMLGDAEPVVNRRVRTAGIEARCAANRLSRNARHLLDGFR